MTKEQNIKLLAQFQLNAVLFSYWFAFLYQHYFYKLFIQTLVHKLTISISSSIQFTIDCYCCLLCLLYTHCTKSCMTRPIKPGSNANNSAAIAVLGYHSFASFTNAFLEEKSLITDKWMITPVVGMFTGITFAFFPLSTL